MKKFLMSLLVIMMTAFVSVNLVSCGDDDGAEEGCIYGIVVELGSNEPMKAVGVELYKGGALMLKTVTFDDGHFEFEKLSPGNYMVKVVADGYEEKEGNVIVEAGRIAKIDLQIKKMSFKNHMVVRTVEPTIVGSKVTLAGEYTYEEGGDYAPSEVGFVYATQDNPKDGGTYLKCKVDNNTKSFSSIKDDFGEGTYYVQAYAKNKIGTEYGEVRSFNLSGATVVVTLEPTNVSASSATLNGRIESKGNPAYSEKGFCYSKSGEPTISDTKVVVSGTDSGDFSYSYTEFSSNTTYYVRAYAIQSGKVHYGTTITFKTKISASDVSTSGATNVKASTATLNGAVTKVGSPAYSEKGFCYSTSSNPTISNTKIVVSGTGEGNYTANVNGLSYNTTYYYKAYVIQEGTPIYGSEVSFKTGYTTAVVETNSNVTDIKYSSAKFGFTVKNIGDPVASQVGICYRTYSNPTVSSNKVTGDVYITSLQKMTVSELNENTTYYYRAYIIQGGKALYGTEYSFRTGERPSVITNAVSNLQKMDGWSYWQAQLNGRVYNMGSPAISECGFMYSEDGDPIGSGIKRSVSGATLGTFSYLSKFLDRNTTYYVRAYVKNELGYEYGELVSFTTGN